MGAYFFSPFWSETESGVYRPSLRKVYRFGLGLQRSILATLLIVSSITRYCPSLLRRFSWYKIYFSSLLSNRTDLFFHVIFLQWIEETILVPVFYCCCSHIFPRLFFFIFFQVVIQFLPFSYISYFVYFALIRCFSHLQLSVTVVKNLVWSTAPSRLTMSCWSMSLVFRQLQIHLRHVFI